MLWIALCVLWTEASGTNDDGMVIFCDGVSAPVPLLRLAGAVCVCVSTSFFSPFNIVCC